MGWQRYWFKKNKVFAEVDDVGEFVVEGGKVHFRYRPNDDRTYSTYPGNLQPIEGAEIVDGPPATPDRPKDVERPQDSEPPRDSAPPKDSAPAPDRPPSAVRHGKVPEGEAGGTVRGKLLLPVAELGEDSELQLLARVPERVAPILAYTDGACRGNPGPAGYGVVLLCGDRRREISGYLGARSTNNIAELTAVLVALREIKQPRRPVLVYTDSTYVIGVLGRGWKAKANPELIEELREEARRFSHLALVKVPAHSGVEENEVADRLGNEAILEHHGKGTSRPQEK